VGALVLLTAVLAIQSVVSAAKKKPLAHNDIPPAMVIPSRPADAITGSEFARRTEGMSEAERQAAALVELRSGNVPPSSRRLTAVSMTGESPDGQPVTATVWVMPDYLSIGSDQDFLRAPLTYSSAAAIANEFGAVLPTPKIVDAVYDRSTERLTPQPLPAGRGMRSSEYCLRHHEMIQQQLQRIEPRRIGDLVAGHKKDVVITNRLLKKPRQIAIYGWHRSSGKPIQPLSTVHEAEYADYSHGVRLVSRTVRIDGQKHSIVRALEDPRVAPALSYEGPLMNVDRLMRRTVPIP